MIEYSPNIISVQWDDTTELTNLGQYWIYQYEPMLLRIQTDTTTTNHEARKELKEPMPSKCLYESHE